jgi:hypothetical protein
MNPLNFVIFHAFTRGRANLCLHFVRNVKKAKIDIPYCTVYLLPKTKKQSFYERDSLIIFYNFCFALSLRRKREIKILDICILEPDDEECMTCNLIHMGSSMPYSDNSCPQCGRDCTYWRRICSSVPYSDNSCPQCGRDWTYWGRNETLKVM